MYQLGAHSLKVLATVKPELQAVVKRAIEISTVDFAVVQGNRTVEEQAALYAKGRTAPGQKVTWTMHSRHIGGNAVDLAAYINGAINWVNLDLYTQIATAMKQAAQELGVDIAWGGDWVTTKDRPHFELRIP